MPNNIFEKIQDIEHNSDAILQKAKNESEKEIANFKANWDNEITKSKTTAKEEGCLLIKQSEEEAKKELLNLEKEKDKKILDLQQVFEKNKNKAKTSAFERFRELCQF